MLTSQQIADKWNARMQTAGAAYTAGVQAYNGNPMALAAAASQKYLNGVQQAVQSGKWQAGLTRNPASYWQQAAIGKGAPRLASGANQAKPKVQGFFDKFLPFLQNNVNQVHNMPSDTFDQRIARMVQMATLNHGFKP